jgi:hypothetical protein
MESLCGLPNQCFEVIYRENARRRFFQAPPLRAVYQWGGMMSGAAILVMEGDYMYTYNQNSSIVREVRRSNMAYLSSEQDIFDCRQVTPHIICDKSHKPSMHERAVARIGDPYQVNFDGDIGYPVTWSAEDIKSARESPDNLMRVTLAEDSEEFKFASSLVLRTCASEFDVLQVISLVNSIQWQRYFLQGMLMKKRLKESLREHWGFHGASKENLINISNEGFRAAFNSRSIFGRGNYFATECRYSLSRRFAPVDDDGNQWVLICRVLVGETKVGCERMKGSDWAGTDALIDNRPTNNMWVVEDGRCVAWWLVCVSRVRALGWD